ncbi:hypothetical protein ABZ446_45770 [Streptomyces sp. NPDC005813]|uniref:hypothetical protein n=1 Tax=Streptomyces sp. NPDC005813 TaxID=3155592 RepID=UPI0034009862
MAILTEYSCKATPGRRVVEVYDADANLGGEDAMAAAPRQVVAGDGYHLYLRSLQPDIDVDVTIRIWDSPTPPPADVEGHIGISVESETGILVVNQLGLGPAGEMTLPRPGVYEGHAWWVNRQAVADYYDTTLDHLTEDSPETQLIEAWHNCPVTERYVLDLAYSREPEPVDDDEDWAWIGGGLQDSHPAPARRGTPHAREWSRGQHLPDWLCGLLPARAGAIPLTDLERSTADQYGVQQEAVGMAC